MVSNGYHDEDYFLKQGRSGGQRCEICKKWIQLPRKRKITIPTFWTQCDDCEIKDDLRRVFHKLNKCLSDEERETFNTWHREMWALGDKLRDLTNGYQAPEIYQGLGRKLMDLVSKISWLEK